MEQPQESNPNSKVQIAIASIEKQKTTATDSELLSNLEVDSQIYKEVSEVEKKEDASFINNKSYENENDIFDRNSKLKNENLKQCYIISERPIFFEERVKIIKELFDRYKLEICVDFNSGKFFIDRHLTDYTKSKVSTTEIKTWKKIQLKEGKNPKIFFQLFKIFSKCFEDVEQWCMENDPSFFCSVKFSKQLFSNNSTRFFIEQTKKILSFAIEENKKNQKHKNQLQKIASCLDFPQQITVPYFSRIIFLSEFAQNNPGKRISVLHDFLTLFANIFENLQKANIDYPKAFLFAFLYSAKTKCSNDNYIQWVEYLRNAIAHHQYSIIFSSITFWNIQTNNPSKGTEELNKETKNDKKQESDQGEENKPDKKNKQKYNTVDWKYTSFLDDFLTRLYILLNVLHAQRIVVDNQPFNEDNVLRLEKRDLRKREKEEEPK